MRINANAGFVFTADKLWAGYSAMCPHGGGFDLKEGPDAPQLSTGMIDVTAACT